jgi:hypothetical protein
MLSLIFAVSFKIFYQTRAIPSASPKMPIRPEYDFEKTSLT